MNEAANGKRPKSVFFRDECDFGISKIDFDKIMKDIIPVEDKFGDIVVFGTNGLKVDDE